MKKTLFLLLATLLAATTQALDAPNIQVSANATVEVMPDFIRVEVQIDKVKKNRQEAKSEADRITAQVIEVARSLKIEEKNIQASDIFIQPEYEWEQNRRTTAGQRVHRTVLIKLYQLDDYSALTEKLARLDITNLQQTGFGFDQIEQHQNQALQLALDKARAKAVLVAERIGRKLGKVHQVTESGDAYPIFQAPMEKMMAMEGDAGAAAAPLEIRAQPVSAAVGVIYLLE